jgi:hypothetical protein
MLATSGASLSAVLPRHAGHKTLAREAPRDRATGGLARADDECRLGLRHGR